MTQEHIATLLDENLLSLEELSVSCTVSHQWVIEHVQAGVLPADPGSDPGRWAFSGRDLLRTRRIHALERDFDANPELAGLVADLVDELERLRIRLRRAGLPSD
ncbi:MAG: MerR family transcriptional regulator [Zoogloea sp.]|nr:MerR family transcriptional regulator [Zoogloea sp.]